MLQPKEDKEILKPPNTTSISSVSSTVSSKLSPDLPEPSVSSSSGSSAPSSLRVSPERSIKRFKLIHMHGNPSNPSQLESSSSTSSSHSVVLVPQSTTGISNGIQPAPNLSLSSRSLSSSASKSCSANPSGSPPSLPPTLSDIDTRRPGGKKRRRLNDDVLARAFLIHKDNTYTDSNRQCRLLLKEGEAELLRIFPQLHPIVTDEFKQALDKEDEYPLTLKRNLIHFLMDLLPSWRSKVALRCDPLRFDAYIKNLGPCCEAFICGQPLFQYWRTPGKPGIPVFPTPMHFENMLSGSYGNIIARFPLPASLSSSSSSSSSS